MTENIIILAGGASSRMKKSVDQNLSPEKVAQANQLSKGLIELGGKPFLSYLLDNILQAGFKNVYIITGENSQMFRRAFENNPDFVDLNIQFATQYIPEGRQKPYGTADALYQCIEQYPNLKEDTFCVCNSDNLYSLNALKNLKNANSHQAILAYDIDHLKYPKERIARFAVMKFDDDYNLTTIVEKPEPDKIVDYTDAHQKIRVSMNIFLFDGKSFFKYLESCPAHPVRDEKELPTALMNMIEDNIKVMGIPIAEHVPDLTSKNDIAILENYLSGS
ncbi:MAG: sugar phosphate nucleotidyltransferase [Flavobacteriaceae bacterium]